MIDKEEYAEICKGIDFFKERNKVAHDNALMFLSLVDMTPRNVSYWGFSPDIDITYGTNEDLVVEIWPHVIYVIVYGKDGSCLYSYEYGMKHICYYHLTEEDIINAAIKTMEIGYGY